MVWYLFLKSNMISYKYGQGAMILKKLLKDLKKIDENIINTLIDKAIKLKVLCRKDNVFNKKYKTGSPLQYLFVKIIFFLNVIFRVNIVPVFDGGFRFFKLFYYDFSCSRLKNFLTNKGVQIFIKWTVPLLIIAEVLVIFLGNAKLIVPVSAFIVIHPFFQIIIVMFLIFFCLTVHELAHYFVYKLYGGTSNEIGAGLMYVIFPVMYVNTINVYYWKNKAQKILLSSAGIIADIIICMSIIILLKYYHVPNVCTVSLSYILFYYIFFTLININFFIPGTDGYYIFSDLIGKNRLYGDSYEEVRRLIGEIIIHRVKKKNNAQIICCLYFIICVINITIYWGTFVLLFTLPIWINYI